MENQSAEQRILGALMRHVAAGTSGEKTLYAQASAQSKEAIKQIIAARVRTSQLAHRYGLSIRMIDTVSGDTRLAYGVEPAAANNNCVLNFILRGQSIGIASQGLAPEDIPVSEMSEEVAFDRFALFLEQTLVGAR
jgi:hypothetical protein